MFFIIWIFTGLTLGAAETSDVHETQAAALIPKGHFPAQSINHTCVQRSREYAKPSRIRSHVRRTAAVLTTAFTACLLATGGLCHLIKSTYDYYTMH